MTTTTELPFDTMHVLRVRGFASATSIAAATGKDSEAAEADLAALAGRSLAVSRDGRVSGWCLTQEGRRAHEAAIVDAIGSGARERLDAIYVRFEPLNAVLKQLCTDWQIHHDTGAPNDHGDVDYDEQVIERLVAHEADAQRLCRELADVDERLGRYGGRLADAVRAVVGGDHTRIAKPLSESYHDVWMELHQDLLLCTGRARTAADA